MKDFFKSDNKKHDSKSSSLSGYLCCCERMKSNIITTELLLHLTVRRRGAMTRFK